MNYVREKKIRKRIIIMVVVSILLSLPSFLKVSACESDIVDYQIEYSEDKKLATIIFQIVDLENKKVQEISSVSDSKVVYKTGDLEAQYLVDKNGKHQFNITYLEDGEVERHVVLEEQETCVEPQHQIVGEMKEAIVMVEVVGIEEELVTSDADESLPEEAVLPEEEEATQQDVSQSNSNKKVSREENTIVSSITEGEFTAGTYSDMDFVEQFTTYAVERKDAFNRPIQGQLPQISGSSVGTTETQTGVRSVSYSNFNVDFRRSFRVKATVSLNMIDNSFVTLGFGRAENFVAKDFDAYFVNQYDPWESGQYPIGSTKEPYPALSMNASQGNVIHTVFNGLKRVDGVFPVGYANMARGQQKGSRYEYLINDRFSKTSHRSQYNYNQRSDIAYEMHYDLNQNLDTGTLTITIGSEKFVYKDFKPSAYFDTSNLTDLRFAIGIVDNHSKSSVAVNFEGIRYEGFNPDAEVKYYVLRDNSYVEVGKNNILPLVGEKVYARVKIRNNAGKGVDDEGNEIDSYGSWEKVEHYFSVQDLKLNNEQVNQAVLPVNAYEYAYTTKGDEQLTVNDFTDIKADKVFLPYHTDKNYTYLQFPIEMPAFDGRNLTISFDLRLGGTPFSVKTIRNLTSLGITSIVPDAYNVAFSNDRYALKYHTSSEEREVITTSQLYQDLLFNGVPLSITDMDTGKTDQKDVDINNQEFVYSTVTLDVYRVNNADMQIDANGRAVPPTDGTGTSIPSKEINRSTLDTYVVVYTYTDIRTGKKIVITRSYLVIDTEYEISKGDMGVALKVEKRNINLPIRDTRILNNWRLVSMFGVGAYDTYNKVWTDVASGTTMKMAITGADDYAALIKAKELKGYPLTFTYTHNGETTSQEGIINLLTSNTYVHVESYWLTETNQPGDLILERDFMNHRKGSKEPIQVGEKIDKDEFQFTVEEHSNYDASYVPEFTTISYPTVLYAKEGEMDIDPPTIIKQYYRKKSVGEYFVIPKTIHLKKEQGINKDYAGSLVEIAMYTGSGSKVKVEMDNGFSIVNADNQMDSYQVELYDEQKEPYSNNQGKSVLGTFINNQKKKVWLNVKKDPSKARARYEGTMSFYFERE